YVLPSVTVARTCPFVGRSARREHECRDISVMPPCGPVAGKSLTSDDLNGTPGPKPTNRPISAPKIPVLESFHPKQSIREISLQDCYPVLIPCLDFGGRSRKVRHLRRHARTNGGRLARVIDHVADHTVLTQRYGND